MGKNECHLPNITLNTVIPDTKRIFHESGVDPPVYFEQNVKTTNDTFD